MNKKITAVILLGLLGLISCNRDDKITTQGFTPPSSGGGSSSTPWNHVMTQSIIPDASNAYDLGSADFPLRDIYVSTNSIKMGEATISSQGSNVNFNGNISAGGSLSIIGPGFIGVGMTNPASALTVDGDIWSTNGYIMAHLGAKHSTNILTWTNGLSLNGAAVGGSAANAFKIDGSGNIILTNNVITNLSTVAGSFISDLNIQLSNITNSTLFGFANFASLSLGLTMAGTSNRIMAQNQPVDYASIFGGVGNRITDSVYGVICGGKGNTIKETGGGSFIGGGIGNIVLATRATIVGGGGPGTGPIEGNIILSGSSASFIGAGTYNLIDANSANAVIAGGYGNNIGDTAIRSAIVGGAVNIIAANATYGFIGGGLFNDIGASATYCIIGGGYDNDIGGGATYCIIGGGYDNDIAANSIYNTIAGGRNCDIAGGHYGHIGGGYDNLIALARNENTIGGGYGNIISGDSGNQCDDGTIAGGVLNTISRSGASAIGGGNGNSITNHSMTAVIGGGLWNRITDESAGSVIGGGYYNLITNALYGTIPGGFSNIVSGTNGFAAGKRASALHEGSYVWSSDANNTGQFASTATNQFLIDALVSIGTNTSAGSLNVHGDYASRGLVGVTVTQVFLGGDAALHTNIFVGGILISGQHFP